MCYVTNSELGKACERTREEHKFFISLTTLFQHIHLKHHIIIILFLSRRIIIFDGEEVNLYLIEDMREVHVE